jgi:hypothetical protein
MHLGQFCCWKSFFFSVKLSPERSFSLSVKPIYKILLQTKELMAVALIVAIVSDQTNV